MTASGLKEDWKRLVALPTFKAQRTITSVVLRPTRDRSGDGATVSHQHLVVEGGPPELENEKSCLLRVDPQCLVTPRMDQYAGISLDEENQHLDRFAETLKAGPPESIGYIFSYAGKNACIYEAGWRGKRIREYLEEKHNFPTKRLVVVDAGFRYALAVELFIQPNAACGPLPTPTRKELKFTSPDAAVHKFVVD